jgi:hypothetical protein
MDDKGKPRELATTKESSMAGLAGGRPRVVGRAKDERGLWNEDMAELL